MADVVDPASLQKVRDFKKAEEGRGEGRLTRRAPSAGVAAWMRQGAWQNDDCGS